MIKSIVVKGEKYKVKMVNANTIDASGDIDSNNKVIQIAKGMGAKLTIETLYHEIGHAIIYETALTEVISSDVQEIIVENFAREFVKHFVDTEGIQEQLNEQID